MNPEKVGKFIKELRKKNHLTQQELADKYGVTYQAVSKWENAKNLPDVSLIRKMSKDFNISIEDILDGEISPKKKPKINIIIVSIVCILCIIIIILFLNLKDNSSFNFKTLSTTCSQFKISGSIAYDKNKSSIYISNITYCGGSDNTQYKKIECNLYEVNGNTNTKISGCNVDKKDVTLEKYLRDVKINIDNYTQMCKTYSNESLYLEINATDKDNKITSYKVPLELKDNCSN